MTIDWQQIVVYAIVAAAALYLWRVSRSRGKAGCGSCSSSGCGPKPSRPEAPDSGVLIQIESAPRRPVHDRDA